MLVFSFSWLLAAGADVRDRAKAADIATTEAREILLFAKGARRFIVSRAGSLFRKTDPRCSSLCTAP